MKVWYEILKDLDEVSLYRGVKMFCAKHTEIFPNTNVPAHIREYALQGNYLSESEAWASLQKALGWWTRIGSAAREHYKQPTIVDGLVKSSLEAMGGWQELYNTDNLAIFRSQFFKIYKGLLESEKRKFLEGA